MNQSVSDACYANGVPYCFNGKCESSAASSTGAWCTEVTEIIHIKFNHEKIITYENPAKTHLSYFYTLLFYLPRVLEGNTLRATGLRDVLENRGKSG